MRFHRDLKIGALKQSPLFEGLSRNQLARLARLSGDLDVPPQVSPVTRLIDPQFAKGRAAAPALPPRTGANRAVGLVLARDEPRAGQRGGSSLSQSQATAGASQPLLPVVPSWRLVETTARVR